MEEKKLTNDTEIDVGMIEKSILFDKEQHVWLLKDSIWKTYSFSKILDLIHRLQGDNKRLTEENKKLSIKVWNYEKPAEFSINYQQLAHCSIADCYRENQDLRCKNAEIQKQVEELTVRTSELFKELQEEKRAYARAVKDTAEKVISDFRNIFIEQSAYGCDVNQNCGYYDCKVKVGEVVEQIEDYAKEHYGLDYGVGDNS